MTVIAWDGKTMAADKRTNWGGLGSITVKIHRVYRAQSDDYVLAGCAGNTAQIAELLYWLSAGAKPETFPAAQRDLKECVSMLMVLPDGTLCQYENTAFPIPILDKQWAIGSGRDFALAAMHLGRTAAEAVGVACHFDSYCGNGIDTLELA